MWAPCGRDWVWLVSVTPVQDWVHSRCSVDGELGKEQDRERGRDAWTTSAPCRVTHCTEQQLGGFQVCPAVPLASASPLSQLQAAAGEEGSVLRLIVLTIPGGFLTPHEMGGAGNPICSV